MISKKVKGYRYEKKNLSKIDTCTKATVTTMIIA